MNWFTKLWNNPNVHIALGTASGIAATMFPAYQVPLMVASGVLGGAGVALPEVTPIAHPPVALPPVINMPASVAGGSYHKEDWANALAALLAQFATPSRK